METTKKVFVNNNMATFICPKCAKSKTVDVFKYMKVGSVVRVKFKCVCGNVHKVLLERRRYHRKITDLHGQYVRLDSGKETDRGRITIKDVSLQGLRFKLNMNQNLNIGDKLLIEFNLDDQYGSFIKKKVVVRNIKDFYVGVEYCGENEYDKYLGFYMRS